MPRYTLAVVVLAVVLGIGAWVVPVSNEGQPWYLGPALFPRLLGLGLVASSLSEASTWRQRGEKEVEGQAFFRVAMAVAALVAAVPLLEWGGLTAAAVPLAGLGGWLLGAGGRGTLGAVLVVAFLAEVVFKRILGVG